MNIFSARPILAWDWENCVFWECPQISDLGCIFLVSLGLLISGLG